nr:4'-phosphopantetheinyl transferase superfamily protein [Isoptericola halotolerans]
MPAERALVADAVPVRRAQFASARRCARAALRDLGRPAAPVLHDLRRRPRWPAGVVGSMSHGTGVAAAVVGSAAAWQGVGIDVEAAVPLPDDVVDMLLTPQERRRLHGWARPEAPGTTVVFSVKESAFKIFSPLTDGWLDPDDVDVRVAAEGAATAELARPLPDGRTRLHGRWGVVGGAVVTLLAAPVVVDRLGAWDFAEGTGQR